MNPRPQTPATNVPLWIAKPELQSLIDVLRSEDYTVVGPTIAQEAIVYDELVSSEQLPIGWRDEQEPGKYRLRRSGNQSYFEFNVGPHSWKRWLFPQQLTVQSADRESGGWRFQTSSGPLHKHALLGVRACELAAIKIQDRIFLHGPYVDRDYQARREAIFIIAVNCTVAAQTCFCTSMNTGPGCQAGYDLALTEIEDGFVVEIGSPQGARIADRLDLRPAPAAALQAADAARQRAVDQIDRQMDTDGLRDLLMHNLDHPHWDQVAHRCLACTNCTMVCPTCFCSTVSDVANLAGNHVDRVRRWDSCFNLEFTYTAGGTVRNDIRSRYRQWLTHKLATWHDQFDSSGCVGCGRCITWCPVGIDLTEEVARIRERPKVQRSLPVPTAPPAACKVPPSKPQVERAHE